MTNTCEKMTVTMERKLNICTNLFIKEYIPKYEIVQMEKPGLYGIVYEKTGELIITFKKLEELYARKYMITLEDNNKMLIDFEDGLQMSEVFWKFIKLIDISCDRYALVSCKDGKRFLIDYRCIYYSLDFTWDISYVVGLDILNEIPVILSKYLNTYDINENFVSISRLTNGSMCAILTDKKNNKKKLLRLSDMRISRYFDEISPMATNLNEYAIVKLNKNKNKAMIIRLKDFVCSREFDSDSELKISDKRVYVKKDGKNVVGEFPWFFFSEIK